MAFIQGYPRFKALLADGSPAVGYKVQSYLSGTTTPTPTYTDQTQSASNSNPVILDGNGEAAIWLAPNISYKLTLKTDADVEVWTLDGINRAEGGFFTTLTVTGAATFATISASGVITSTVAPGTAPLSILSPTVVPNLNASQLLGKTWAAPDDVGITTPKKGFFSDLTVTGPAQFSQSLSQIGGFGRTLTSVNNATLVTSQLSEEITLNTAGTTTDSVGDLLQLDSIILGVVARVTEAITVATNWALGDSVTAARFLSATTDVTLGTQKVGLNHMKGSVASDAAGPTQAASAKLRITTTGTPSSGKIRVTVFYLRLIAPSS